VSHSSIFRDGLTLCDKLSPPRHDLRGHPAWSVVWCAIMYSIGKTPSLALQLGLRQRPDRQSELIRLYPSLAPGQLVEDTSHVDIAWMRSGSSPSKWEVPRAENQMMMVHLESPEHREGREIRVSSSDVAR